jgi:hypothetical protein
MPSVTNQPLTVSYFIDDISGALATFDSIRWWKSTTGQSGLYQRITELAATPAVVRGLNTGPFVLQGLELLLRIDGVTDVAYTFVGADPISLATVISELTAIAAGAFVPTDDGVLVLTSATTGTGSSIEVLPSEAALVLGINGQTVLGRAANTPLVSGTHEYFFTDQNSDYDYWYKVEFYHTSTLDRSELSAPISADQVQAIPASQTIVGYIRLATMTGRPDAGRKVIVFNNALPNVQTGHGVVRFYEEITTDRTGYAKLRLLRGIDVSFSIAGTGVARKITVPETGDAFDFLDPALVSDDEFGIHYQDVPFATRTS